MKPTSRKIKKWRKDSPASHRSYAEKRNRSVKHVEEEIRNNINEDRKYKENY